MVRRDRILQGGGMDPHSTLETPPTETPRPPARRSSTDRVAGGVSTAAAQYLGVSLGTARILFVVATLVGGLGLVLYSVLWLVVPDDRDRVLIQGAAASAGESSAAALVAGVATLTLSTWITRDGPSWLASILVAVAVVVLSRRGPTDVEADPAAPPPTPPPTPPAPPPTPPSGSVGPDLGQPSAGPGPDDPVVGTSGPDTAVTGVLPLVAERPRVYPRAIPGPRSAERLDPPPPKPPRQPAFVGPLTVSIAVALAGSLGILDAVGAIDLRPSDVLIAVLVVIGTGLMVSTWFGRARGLILLGLLLVPVVAVSAAADRIDLRGGVGERTWAPQTAAQLRDRYRLGAGSMQLDLTGMRTPTVSATHPALRTRLSLGAGRVQLIVPETWSLDVTSTVDLGAVWSYAGGTVVPEGSDEAKLGPGDVRWDLGDAHGWYFPERAKVPDDASSGGDARHTIRVVGDADAPTLDVDVAVTAGVVEVFRVAS